MSELLGINITATLTERAELLEGTRWASNLTSFHVKKLAEYVDVFEVLPGTTLFLETEHSSYMCLLIEGSVAILKKDSNGEDKKIASIGAGTAFGEMSLVDDEPRSASAIAESHLRMLVLRKEKMDRLIEEAPVLAVKVVQNIAKLISRRLRMTSGSLVDLLAEGGRS